MATEKVLRGKGKKEKNAYKSRDEDPVLAKKKTDPGLYTLNEGRFECVKPKEVGFLSFIHRFGHEIPVLAKNRIRG